MLESNGLHWNSRKDGFALRFASALITLELAPIAGQHLLMIRAPVLRELDAPEHRSAEVLEALNQLNCESHFGKWTFHNDHAVIVLEYDMLADYLQEAELMMAVAMIARLADQQDDRLQARFGGQRAFEDPTE